MSNEQDNQSVTEVVKVTANIESIDRNPLHLVENDSQTEFGAYKMILTGTTWKQNGLFVTDNDFLQVEPEKKVFIYRGFNLKSFPIILTVPEDTSYQGYFIKLNPLEYDQISPLQATTSHVVKKEPVEDVVNPFDKKEDVLKTHSIQEHDIKDENKTDTHSSGPPPPEYQSLEKMFEKFLESDGSYFNGNVDVQVDLAASDTSLLKRPRSWKKLVQWW